MARKLCLFTKGNLLTGCFILAASLMMCFQITDFAKGFKIGEQNNISIEKIDDNNAKLHYPDSLSYGNHDVIFSKHVSDNGCKCTLYNAEDHSELYSWNSKHDIDLNKTNVNKGCSSNFAIPFAVRGDMDGFVKAIMSFGALGVDEAALGGAFAVAAEGAGAAAVAAEIGALFAGVGWFVLIGIAL